MEAIHLKTIDPYGQKLLLAASRQGLDLAWERYERLQPQDGFLRLGLSCPFGCLQGPCRVDPFGRGAQSGICGLDKDEMVAGMLLRLVLQGTLEAFAAVAPAIPGMPASLPHGLQQRMQALCGNDSNPASGLNDIYTASLMLGGRRGECKDLIHQVLRLSLLSLGAMENSHPEKNCNGTTISVGSGVLRTAEINIGVTGKPSLPLLNSIAGAVTRDMAARCNLISLGECLPVGGSLLPTACTSGEAELLISGGGVHLVLAGPGTTAGIFATCRNLHIPVISLTSDITTAEIVQQAVELGKTLHQTDTATFPAANTATMLASEETIRESLLTGATVPIALVGGSDTVSQTMGQLPVELARRLSERQVRIVSWGDGCLWMVKHGLAVKEHTTTIVPLAADSGILQTVKVLAANGSLDRLQGICYTGLRNCAELAGAIGLAALGCRVCIAGPLPILGSPTATEILADTLQRTGGQLTFFDHPPHSQELFDWFIAERPTTHD